MSRVASRYRLTAKELIGALVDVGRRPNLFTVQPDGEVVFNTEARAVIAAFCRMPEEHLHRALPSWSRDVPSSRLGSGPAAWVRTAATIPPTGPGCRACTARATQGRDTARRYLPPHARICVKHQCWMLETPVVDGAPAGPGQLDLRHVPQIAAAQRHHTRLLRRCPHADEAFTMAQAILASWWDEPWPEETIWPDRLRLMAAGNGLARRTAARDAVTYPEAVTLAAALADTGVQQRLLDEAGRHQPHSLADVPHLVGELARRLERPWIADRLTVATTGPLNAWVRACVRTRAGNKPKTRSMWRLSPPQRPVPVSRLLAESCNGDEAPVKPEPPSPLEDTEDAAAGFTRGLRHARTYAAEYGHLCAPNTVRVDGFAVGLWLANQRAAGPELAPERAAALDALDPWWNPPWNMRWQQSLHTARAHTADRPLNTTADLDALPTVTSKWLFTQCASYDSLGHEQRQLLAGMGLTTERARALAPSPKPPQPSRPARPRLKNSPSSIAAGLPYARSWAAQHGNLTSASYRTEHDGFPLGWWLYKQRRAAYTHLKRTGQPWPHHDQLAALDPWWNPPWRATWNHSRHQAHTHHSTAQSFPNNTTKWIRTQQRAWDQLHPHQQHLMTTLGIHGPTPLCRYNSHPKNLTNQPTDLINTNKTNAEQETRSPQARPGPTRKQHQTSRQHTPHRRTQPAN
ncbi:helicase associated domain-containing protein [Streptomyces rhizosphaericus]|uniref:helicase associated domain-containing protein n=1 Tax=Streptomyces rhizosphaericus TaxID=114699 RepID=UPI00117C6FE4|nr:helicase associated domain-containing protein [Streptomyces rhizosphaericus]